MQPSFSSAAIGQVYLLEKYICMYIHDMTCIHEYMYISVHVWKIIAILTLVVGPILTAFMEKY